MSDEAHAIETLRTFYFANKALFNSIKDDLWAMEGYEYWTFGKQADGSDWTSVCIKDGDDICYPDLDPDDVEPALREKLRHYFEALGPMWCTVGLAHWGSVGNNTNLDRVVAFEFGFLDKPGNEIVSIVYSPKRRDHFVERLERNWYISVSHVIF